MSMRENIAKACNIDVSCVSVKATTEEHLGFTGDGSGMACHAVCLLENKQKKTDRGENASAVGFYVTTGFASGMRPGSCRFPCGTGG